MIGLSGMSAAVARRGVLRRITELEKYAHIREVTQICGGFGAFSEGDIQQPVWQEEAHADLTGYYLESKAANKWLDSDARYAHLREEPVTRDHPPGKVRLYLLNELASAFGDERARSRLSAPGS